VGIVALDPRHKTHNVPGKFLAYLRAGIPVLARINTGNDLERLIKEERVGMACMGGDATTLQKLADEMLANPAELRAMGDRGKTVWKRLFAPSTAVKQIVSALSRDKDTGERHSSDSAGLDRHRQTFVSPSIDAGEKE
jgi:hypothetical protein